MSLVTITEGLHKKSGFTGPRLQAVTFATALHMADYACTEHQDYFRRRFRETLETLDSEGVSDVVGFVAGQLGIKPGPVENTF